MVKNIIDSTKSLHRATSGAIRAIGSCQSHDPAELWPCGALQSKGVVEKANNAFPGLFYAFTAAPTKVKLWNVETKQCAMGFKGHNAEVRIFKRDLQESGSVIQ